eukprot:1761935-Pyramimonas_sp.AAC.1
MDRCEQYVLRYLRRWRFRILYTAASEEDLRRRTRNLCRQAWRDSDANRHGRAICVTRMPRTNDIQA